MEKPPEVPSGEAVLDLTTIVERTMLAPGDDLEGIFVLAIARGPDGKVKNRMLALPLDQEERLRKYLRGFLDGPPGLLEYRQE